jgi:hypothetical protein
VRWLVAGTHTLRVTLGSTPVAGSPFLVHVAAAAVDSMQCVLLHPPASLVCGEPHSLQLQVRLSSLSPLSRLLSPLPSLHSLSLSVSLSLSLPHPGARRLRQQRGRARGPRHRGLHARRRAHRHRGACSLGDAESSMGDAESSLGDAKSSMGDAKPSLGDAKSSMGDAKPSLGDVYRCEPGVTVQKSTATARPPPSPSPCCRSARG